MATAAAGALRTDGDALSRARRSAVAVFAIRVAAAGLAYGTQVLLARAMGKEGYGVFATAWVWIARSSAMPRSAASGFACAGSCPSIGSGARLDLARGFLIAGAGVAIEGGIGIAALGAGALWALRDLVSGDYLLPLAVALCVVPVFALQDYVEGEARS